MVSYFYNSLDIITYICPASIAFVLVEQSTYFSFKMALN